jgi:hypothetical protein
MQHSARSGSARTPARRLQPPDAPAQRATEPPPEQLRLEPPPEEAQQPLPSPALAKAPVSLSLHAVLSARPQTAFGRLAASPRDPWAVVRSFGVDAPHASTPRSRRPATAAAGALEPPPRELLASLDAQLSFAAAEAQQLATHRYREWRTTVYEPLEAARTATAPGGRRLARISDPLSRSLRQAVRERAVAVTLGLAPPPPPPPQRHLVPPPLPSRRAAAPGGRSAFAPTAADAALAGCAPRRQRRALSPPPNGTSSWFDAASVGRRDVRCDAQRIGSAGPLLSNAFARPSTPGVAARRQITHAFGGSASGGLVPFGRPEHRRPQWK